MPDGLNPVVQRMIDAGESEDNIAAVIRHYKQQAPSVVADSEPGTFAGGFVKSLKDQFAQAVGPDTSKQDPFVVHGAPPAVEKMMSTPLAHPTGFDTVDGFTSPAGLLMLGSGAVEGLAGSPAARSGLGKALQFVGENADITKPLKMVGKAGEWLQDTAVPPPSPPPVPTGPHMDLSKAIQPGSLTQQQIGERIAAVKAAGGTTVPPTAPKGMLGGRLQMAQPERPPITVAPESPMQPTATVPMQGPRVDVGAEVVGRQNGLTTQQVRDATGPIRGEAQGAPAGMPNAPMNRIVQKLIDMGPKGQGLPESARESYAAAATSDKARLQTQAYLDALRKVGFVVPAATSAEAVRQAVMKRLQGEQ